MSNDETFTIQMTRQFSQTQEQVYGAWLDPGLAGRFLFATPTGEMVRVEIDPRVGGTFLFVDRRDGVEVSHSGVYVELVPPTRIVFDFSVDGSESSRVALDITPNADGCLLTLTHTLSTEWLEYRERVANGWGMILDGLANSVE